MNPSLRPMRRGYTLLEVMIAITIFAAVVAAIYSCWSAVLRGSRGGLDAAAEVQRGRIAQRSLEDALTTAQLVPENLHFYSFFGETSGDFGYLSFVARLPLSFPGSGIFGDQVLRRVTFSIEPGENSSSRLVMTQMPYLMAQTVDQEPYSIVLAKNVSLFAVQFWSTNASVGAVAGQGEWLDVWPFTNRFPTKVRYALGFNADKKQPGAIPYVINSIVHMPSVAVPDRLQSGGTGPAPTGPGGGNQGGGNQGGSIPGGANQGGFNQGGRGYRDPVQSGGTRPSRGGAGGAGGAGGLGGPGRP